MFLYSDPWGDCLDRERIVAHAAPLEHVVGDFASPGDNVDCVGPKLCRRQGTREHLHAGIRVGLAMGLGLGVRREP